MIARRRGVARSAVRLAAGTAVMAGTAGVVRHHQEQKYAQQDAQNQAAADAQYEAQVADQQMAQMQQQMAMQQQQIEMMKAQQAQAAAAPAPAPAAAPAPAPAPAPAAAPAGGTDLNSKLKELAQLRNDGILTDEEFAAAKAKLLAGG